MRPVALGLDHRQDRRQDLRRPQSYGGLGDHRGDRGDLYGQGNGDLWAAGGAVAGRQALDSESEQAIQKALRTLCEGRTTIVIAHRLSTVAQADEICVIDRGRIVERGRHGELLAMGRTYTHIAQTQFPRDAA